jgi:hypothetical protein
MPKRSEGNDLYRRAHWHTTCSVSGDLSWQYSAVSAALPCGDEVLAAKG